MNIIGKTILLVSVFVPTVLFAASSDGRLIGVTNLRDKAGNVDGCSIAFVGAGSSSLNRLSVGITGSIAINKAGYGSVKAAGLAASWNKENDDLIVSLLGKLGFPDWIADARSKGATSLEIAEALTPSAIVRGLIPKNDFEIKTLSFRSPAAWPISRVTAENKPFALWAYKLDESMSVITSILDGKDIVVYVEPVSGGSVEFTMTLKYEDPEILQKSLMQMAACVNELLK